MFVATRCGRELGRLRDVVGGGECRFRGPFTGQETFAMPICWFPVAGLLLSGSSFLSPSYLDSSIDLSFKTLSCIRVFWLDSILAEIYSLS